MINHFTTPEGKTFTFNTDELCPKDKDGEFYKVSKRLKGLNPHIDFDYLAHDLEYRGLRVANNIEGMLHTTRKYYIYERILLDSACNEGFEDCDYYNALKTDKEKVTFIYGRFMSEYGWCYRREQPSIKPLIDWLQGLALNIPYMYCDIIKLREQFEERGLTEKEQEQTCDNYWRFMAMRLRALFEYYDLPY